MNDMVEQDLTTAPSLDLPAFKIEKFFTPKDNGKFMLFFVNVRQDWRPKDGCPYCGNVDSLSLSGRNPPRVIRDVSRNNYCIQIVTQSPRMLCKKCFQRFSPKIDGIIENGTMTERLVDFIKTESFLQPHTTIEERTGVSIQTIQNIMDEEIERYEKMRAAKPLTAPRILGIDEKHIVHEMRGTLVDIESGNLLEITEKNDEISMTNAIKKLTDWDTKIEVVTTDMANRYLRWIPNLLPKATVVIDKFHVVQDINQKISSSKKVLYEYRKQLIDGITDSVERKRQFEILYLINDNKRLFNYSSENLERGSGDKALKLDTVIDEFPEFALLRKIYSYIELLYKQDNRENAEKVWNEWQKFLPPSSKSQYNNWCKRNNVPPQCFETFQSLTRPGFTNFKEYILNYFNPGCRFTNATTEGLNNLIGTINAAGNGYKFKHLRAKALYASLVHERVRFSVDVTSIKSWKPNTKFVLSPLNGSDDENSIDKRYIFNKTVQQVSIPTTNIYSDNDALQDTLIEDSIGYAIEFVYEENTLEKYFVANNESKLKQLLYSAE